MEPIPARTQAWAEQPARRGKLLRFASPVLPQPGRDQQHPSAVPSVGTGLPWAVLSPTVKILSTNTMGSG